MKQRELGYPSGTGCFRVPESWMFAAEQAVASEIDTIDTMPVLPGCTLIVRVNSSCFRFEPPMGEPLAWEKFGEKKQEALRHLLNHT